LGLTEARFWRLSPRQLDALLDRHRESQLREERRLGTALSWLLAPHVKRPLEPADFFPRLKEPEKPQTPQDMISVIKSLNPPPRTP
ncbi:MAG TPA: hypothetical protein VGD74_05520, partial [Vulgatibacter sp.]